MRKRIAFVALIAMLGTQPVGAAQTGPMILPDGSTAFIKSGALAQVWSADHRTVTYRKLTPSLLGPQRVDAAVTPPSKDEALAQLRHASPRAYASDEVLIGFRPGVGSQSTRFVVPTATVRAMRTTQNVPAYTNDSQTNRTLANLGVDRTERFAPNAYRVHLTARSVRDGIAALAKLPAVSYVSPNWYVATMQAPQLPVPAAGMARAQSTARALAFAPRALRAGAEQHDIPANYAVSASAQSLLNAPGLNAIGAYDEISRAFHQLPGQGEIITNVSIGDLTDISALGPPATPAPRGGAATKGGKGGGGGGGDPCAGAVAFNGPTTVLNAGQRYIDWPSLPLIPTYVADASGNLSGSAEVCNSPDNLLGEVGLDFSVMAPLPHALQRPSAQGSGFTDLLGIAPGASYRLVVPSNRAPTIADLDAALLGAALQTPRPNVITASLGFGFDALGFPSRYLEEDPLSNAIVSSIVAQYDIVVCIAANDGLRVFTNAAVAPSGGSAATQVVAPGGTPTSLNDLAFSGAPSSVFDSGAIDAGGTTLDDIFAAPPQNPQNQALAAQHAFPVARYTGQTTFSSGFGSRVNVSAPADNIPAMQHGFGGNANAVAVYLESGTSASAPEIAAAAAVVLQVGRLTGRPFQTARAVREFLSETGTAVPNAPQADEPLSVGPQVDLTNAVETLLARSGRSVSPSLARIAVSQRRPIGIFGGAFVTDTDPSAIDLQGTLDAGGAPTGNNRLAWITIAPDWEGVSPRATFALSLGDKPGHTKLLSQGRWARLLPETILRAAGLPPASPSNRTVTLTYAASDRGHTVSLPVTLTFGPSNGTSTNALAPNVGSVERGDRIAVAYDLTSVRNVTRPLVIVSSPGRLNPSTGFFFHPLYVEPLPNLKGTVYVPVRRLQGDGVYGVTIGLRNDPNGGVDVSDFAYTHVLGTAHDVHAAAPLLGTESTPPGHMLEIPYRGTFTVSWDVSDVPGANGARLEFSAPGPTGTGNLNPVNNPGGTIRDANGVDAGSVYYATVAGRRGTVRLNGATIGLVPTMNHVVRIIPLAGSEPAGEGSPVSTILMDGVVPADGGTLENGYAINPNADDGFLTSASIANGVYTASVETFKQSTAAVAVTTSSPADAFVTTGSSVWDGDIGIVGTVDLSISGRPPSATTYRLMSPVANNALGASWQPPALNDGVSQIVQTAPNAANSTALVLSGDPLGSSPAIPYQVFTSNLGTNTFGPSYNINAALPQAPGTFATSLAQDSSTKTGYVGLANFNTSCGPPTFASVDLNSGNVSAFNPTTGAGFPLDLAIDPTTHIGAYQTQCDGNLNIVDLTTHAVTTVPLPGNAGLYNAIDPVHHLIAVEMAAGGTAGDNNAISSVYIYDEAGHLLKTLERFNFYGTGLTVNANNLQLNPKTRTGYMFGPNANQLEPFNY